MTSPFAIDGPAVVSFSGGRTSAYMLRRILDEGLRPDVHVLFANTGKEREETLEFVRACGEHWGVRIHWVERALDGNRATFREVDFETASRRGEPFEALLEQRRTLPGGGLRFCTTELKVRVMASWMRARGYDHWDMVIGIRADEPRRVARLRAKPPEVWEHVLPLADAGVTVRDIDAFWREQPFDLRLRPWEGNCDLCHLKSAAKLQRIMSERPELADWWIRMERHFRAQFRRDAPSYAALLDATQRQLRLLDSADLGDCLCHEGTTEAA